MARDQVLAIRMHSSVARPRKAIPRMTAAGLTVVVLAGIPVLPLAAVAVAGIATMLGVVAFELGGERASRAFASHAARRERGRRRAKRHRALVSAGCSREPILELEGLISAIETGDPALAHRIDFETLLDRYAALAVGHQQALRAVTLTERAQLQRTRDELRADPLHDPRRLELCERRLCCHEECEARVQALADELAIIADLIRLVAQRVACPDELAELDSIEHCLAELDSRDAAQHLLATELR